MHDPMTMAFRVKVPLFFKRENSFIKGGQKEWQYYELATIWHVDPCTDHTDDSCGWFKRPRHGNQEHYAKIKREFDYDFDKTSKSDDGKTTYYFGWFHPSGEPMYSAISISLGLFHRAATIHFNSHDKAWRFMEKNMYRIVAFAENPHDSMLNTIQNKYREKREERVASLAQMIYGCILRWDQKWWRHPRWHIHHWQIQIHPVQKIWNWLTRRCCKCGKRFKYNECPIGSWDGSSVWHERCDDSSKPQST